MNSWHFDIPEFVKLDSIEADIPISPTVAQKIWEYHLLPLNDVRGSLGLPVYVRSGFRPVWWELANERDGDSQHCFEGKGASDVSLEQHSASNNKPSSDWLRFFDLLCDSPYKRICYYPDLRFFHCDYNAKDRQYFINEGKWRQSDSHAIEKLIRTRA